MALRVHAAAQCKTRNYSALRATFELLRIYRRGGKAGRARGKLRENAIGLNGSRAEKKKENAVCAPRLYDLS